VVLQNWENIEGCYFEGCSEDAVCKSVGISRLVQFPAATLVVYCRRGELGDMGGMFMFMPLPHLPPEHHSSVHQDFAVVLPSQKDDIDQQFVELGAGSTMDPLDFREWMEDLSESNCGNRYFRFRTLEYGGMYFGQVCTNFIVSVIEDNEVPLVISDGAQPAGQSFWLLVEKS